MMEACALETKNAGGALQAFMKSDAQSNGKESTGSQVEKKKGERGTQGKEKMREC